MEPGQDTTRQQQPGWGGCKSNAGRARGFRKAGRGPTRAGDSPEAEQAERRARGGSQRSRSTEPQALPAYGWKRGSRRKRLPKREKERISQIR